MAAEIERKFLVSGDAWNDGSPGVRMAQGYLTLDPDRCVRVRLTGEHAWLTVKGRTLGITRAEFEYPIPSIFRLPRTIRHLPLLRTHT